MIVHSHKEAIPASVIRVEQNNILRLLGIPEGRADEYVIGIVHSVLQKCHEICAPQIVYTIYDNPVFLLGSGEMKVGELVFALNKMVTAALARSSSVAFFIGTCGDQIEKYSKTLMRDGNTLESLIADFAGSEMAECIAEYAHNKIEKDAARQGLLITNRYSPGYCNWPVSDQQKVFLLMQPETCGVTLTTSSLMLPVKSVSGITGLGKSVTKSDYACARCEMDHCLYRDKNRKTDARH